MITEDDGSYTIEGLTEKSSTLTIDGETDGITVNENGSFSITKKLSDNENYKSHTLKAVDNAGNVTELMVYAVRKGSFAIKEIELKNNGEDIQTVDGEKKISMKSGQNTKLSAFAVLDDGKEFELSDDMIDWSVLYEKNRIALDEGDITALSKGETAVKVKMNSNCGRQEYKRRIF